MAYESCLIDTCMDKRMWYEGSYQIPRASHPFRADAEVANQGMMGYRSFLTDSKTAITTKTERGPQDLDNFFNNY